MKLVGLTGGIACGKSTFSQFLTQSGVEIIDCDLVARDVVRKVRYQEGPVYRAANIPTRYTHHVGFIVQGTWGYRRVLAVFGRGILQADGEKRIEVQSAKVSF